MCENCIYFVSYGNLFDTGFCIKYLEEKEKSELCFDEQETTSSKIYNTFTGGSYE